MWPPHKGFNQSPFLQAHQSLRRSAKVEGVVWCQPWNTHVPPKEDLRKRPPLKTTPHARRYKMATDLPHNTNPDQPHRDAIDYASHRTNIVGKDPVFHCSNFTLDSEPFEIRHEPLRQLITQNQHGQEQPPFFTEERLTTKEKNPAPSASIPCPETL